MVILSERGRPVMLTLGEDLVAIRAQRVDSDALRPGIHFQVARDLAHPDVAASQRPGHRVAIGPIGHVRITADPPRDLGDVRVRRSIRKRL